MATLKSAFLKKPEKITYWRNSTKEDIKFGHGAIHYRDFDFNLCFDKNNELILKARATDDGLIYFYPGRECSNSSKSKLQEISI